MTTESDDVIGQQVSNTGRSSTVSCSSCGRPEEAMQGRFCMTPWRHQGRSQTRACVHPPDMTRCRTCGQVGPDEMPHVEVVAHLRRSPTPCAGQNGCDHALGVCGAR